MCDNATVQDSCATIPEDLDFLTTDVNTQAEESTCAVDVGVEIVAAAVVCEPAAAGSCSVEEVIEPAAAGSCSVEVVAASISPEVQVVGCSALAAAIPEAPVHVLPDAGSHAPGCQQVPTACACSVHWLFCRQALGEPVYHPRSGKWMLFPALSEVDAVWGRVCTLTRAGRLGHAAKVAASLSRDPGRPVLICVYLPDSLDVPAVMAALCTLRDEGLYSASATACFKMDAQTFQNVYSAGDKRPRGAGGAEAEAEAVGPSIPPSRYTSPPPRGPAPASLQLFLNHVTASGQAWDGETLPDLAPSRCSLVAQRKGAEVAVLPSPYALLVKPW